MQMYLLFRDINNIYYAEFLIMRSWISSHVVPCHRIVAPLRIIRSALPRTEAGPSVPERDQQGRCVASIPCIQGDLTIAPRTTIGRPIPSSTLDTPGTGSDYVDRFERRPWPSRTNLSISRHWPLRTPHNQELGIITVIPRSE